MSTVETKPKKKEQDKAVFKGKAMIGKMVHYWPQGVRSVGVDPRAAMIVKSYPNGVVSLQCFSNDSGGVSRFIQTAYHISDSSCYGPGGTLTEKAKMGMWDFFDETEREMPVDRGSAYDPDLDAPKKN